MRTMAAVATGSVLVRETAERERKRSLAAGAGAAGGESVDRSGQRVSSAPAVVDHSAMDVLLGQDFAVAGKDRLYRCLDRVLEHKQDLFVHLQQRWKDLFNAEFDLLLYDLTSTYVEGEAEQNPKARYGYSRDKRPDCWPVVIALIVTPAGLPLAYEGMAGNTSEKTTLRGFLDRIENLYGKARRVWLMDRGIPTEALLREMRTSRQETFYLVGTSRAKIREYEKQWLEL